MDYENVRFEKINDKTFTVHSRLAMGGMIGKIYAGGFCHYYDARPIQVEAMRDITSFMESLNDHEKKQAKGTHE